ncbi:MAG: hypothetical protein MHM6MM_001249 [Cercozoa sp. M6MM]
MQFKQQLGRRSSAPVLTTPEVPLTGRSHTVSVLSGYTGLSQMAPSVISMAPSVTPSVAPSVLTLVQQPQVLLQRQVPPLDPNRMCGQAISIGKRDSRMYQLQISFPDPLSPRGQLWGKEQTYLVPPSVIEGVVLHGSEDFCEEQVYRILPMTEEEMQANPLPTESSETIASGHTCAADTLVTALDSLTLAEGQVLGDAKHSALIADMKVRHRPDLHLGGSGAPGAIELMFSIAQQRRDPRLPLVTDDQTRVSKSAYLPLNGLGHRLCKAYVVLFKKGLLFNLVQFQGRVRVASSISMRTTPFGGTPYEKTAGFPASASKEELLVFSVKSLLMPLVDHATIAAALFDTTDRKKQTERAANWLSTPIRGSQRIGSRGPAKYLSSTPRLPSAARPCFFPRDQHNKHGYVKHMVWQWVLLSSTGTRQLTSAAFRDYYERVLADSLPGNQSKKNKREHAMLQVLAMANKALRQRSLSQSMHMPRTMAEVASHETHFAVERCKVQWQMHTTAEGNGGIFSIANVLNTDVMTHLDRLWADGQLPFCEAAALRDLSAGLGYNDWAVTPGWSAEPINGINNDRRAIICLGPPVATSPNTINPADLILDPTLRMSFDNDAETELDEDTRISINRALRPLLLVKETLRLTGKIEAQRGVYRLRRLSKCYGAAPVKKQAPKKSRDKSDGTTGQQLFKSTAPLAADTDTDSGTVVDVL